MSFFPVFVPNGLVAMDIRYHGTYSSGSNATTYTSTAHAIGSVPSSSQRRFVVAIPAGNDNDASNVSSVTIGGTAATVVVDETDGVATNTICGAIYWREVSTGTTADIVTTFDGSQGGFALAVYSIITDKATVNATGTTAAAAVDTTMTVTEKGVAIAAMAARGSSPTSTLVAGNYTKDADETGGGNSSVLATASYEVTASGSSTCNWTEGTPDAKIGMQAVFSYS